MSEDKARILAIAREYAHECAIVATEKVCFRPEVRDACKANLCGKYGKCWTCPPGVGTVEELQAKCTVYSDALVFSTLHNLEDSFDFEGMTAGMQAHNAIEKELVARLGLSDRLVLGAGTCERCEKCTYPDAPCRFPDLIQPTVEACGISVVDLAKTCEIRYTNGENTVTYFSVVFFNREDAGSERA